MVQRNGSERVVFIGGVWDLLHTGHINILKKASLLGDILIVGVLTDDGAARYKRRPSRPLQERLQIVESLRFVDQAVAQPDTDPTSLFDDIQPDVLVHGDDWDRVPGEAWMKEHGREVIFLPYTPGVSTTQILLELFTPEKL